MTLDEILDQLVIELRKKLTGPPKPNSPQLVQLGKRTVIMLNYSLKLPDATAADVVGWKLETTVNGGEAAVADATDGMIVSFNQGDSVSLRLQEIDDAGNSSEWSDSYDFTASDTLPPPKPGQVAVTLVSES